MLQEDIKIIKEQQENNKSTDKELLDFALMLLENEASQKTIKANQKIRDGITYLAKTNDWGNLSGVMKHAAAEMVTAAKNDKRIKERSIIQIFNFKRDIANMGKSEFIGLLTEDAKTKYFKGE